MGFPEQDQTRDFTASWQIQADRLIGVRFAQSEQSLFIGGSFGWIDQKISRSLQQIAALKQRLVGETLIRWTFNTGLKSAQNRRWLSGGTDAQQSEMIDGQIQSQRSTSREL